MAKQPTTSSIDQTNAPAKADAAKTAPDTAKPASTAPAQPAADEKEYTVIEPLKHNGKAYTIGERVKMAFKDAEHLIGTVIEEIEEAVGLGGDK